MQVHHLQISVVKTVIYVIRIYCNRQYNYVNILLKPEIRSRIVGTGYFGRCLKYTFVQNKFLIQL